MTKESNAYFDGLFTSFDTYVSTPGDLGGSTLINGKDVKINFSSFESNTETLNGFINVAGNYKYTCIIPLDPDNKDERPPNYIGVLKENNALPADSLISEILSFTCGNYGLKMATSSDPIHNNTRLSSALYGGLYRSRIDKHLYDSDVRMINFTQGLPYSIYEPSLRLVHRDISKRINRLIDYAIVTGQTSATPIYDNELTKRFLDIFFANPDNISKATPHYYSLRTGILPSVISYLKFLKAGGTLDSHANDYTAELESVGRGSVFMPSGKSYQFFETGKKQHLYWYPFTTIEPYSYSFFYGDDKSNLEDLKYIMKPGFNHYLLTSKESSIATSVLDTLINAIPADTDAINKLMGTGNKVPTVLSYESSLMDTPGPRQIRVLPQTSTKEYKDDMCSMDGRITKPITNIIDWVNPIKDGSFDMNPLMNITSKDNGYLKIDVEAAPSYISPDDQLSNTPDMEEAYYYNHCFQFAEETDPIDRLNYFNSNDSNSCDPYALEFAQVTRKLYDVTADSGELKLSTATIDEGAFGAISKIDEEAWHSMSIGITKRFDTLKDILTTEKGTRPNLLFGLYSADATTPVKEVNLPIRAVEYGGPREFSKRACMYMPAEESIWHAYDHYCRPIPIIMSGPDHLDAIMVFDPGASHEDHKGWEDFKTLDVKVNIDRNTGAVTKYNENAVHAISKTVMEATNVKDFYYTIHVLADDGNGAQGFTISNSTGVPDFDNTNKEGVNYESNDNIDAKRSRYGTGIQYFFGGVCSKAIYDAYYERGLTVQQLLDSKGTRIEEGGYSRIRGGLRRANTTFEWDYDVLIQAWQIALWIMKGRPADESERTTTDVCKEDNDDCHALWNAPDSPIAISAFFDYIYETNGAKLLLGPSLKQINDIVGPYGSDPTAGDKGGSTTMNALRGKAWEVANTNDVSKSPGYEIMKNKGGIAGAATYGSAYNDMKEHARAAAHVYVDSDLPLYEGYYKMGKNGVPFIYWANGGPFKVKADATGWGRHYAKSHRGAFESNAEGYVHLDHYSWDWQLSDNNESPTKGDTQPWQGVFMIHADKGSGKNSTVDGTGGTFNWNLGPFHEVSPAAHMRSTAYGTRSKLSEWTNAHYNDNNDDDSSSDQDDGHKGGACSTGTDELIYKQAWEGIKGYTHGNQNPNIRVRLPMLWRYLKALRLRDKIYTDGQLMPCGIELHYCTASKALVTSIAGTESPIPVTRYGDDTNNLDTWRETICDPSSMVFAEVLRDTYAISKTTIDKWKNLLFAPEATNLLIKNLLSSIDHHRDKLTAMNRAKRYISKLQKLKTIDITKGKAVYNIPILPSIATFGMAIDKTGKTGEGSESSAETSSEPPGFPITIGSSMKTTYKEPPMVTINPFKIDQLGIGVTNPPSLDNGASENQFTAISRALYTDILNFDGGTIGWIVPLPIRSNLALLNAFNGQWRDGLSTVIPLHTNDYQTVIETINAKNVRWIGWVDSDHVSLLNNLPLIVCNVEGNEKVSVPMVSLKITPVWNYGENQPTEKDLGGGNKPITVKLEIDTRGSGIDNLSLIMIRDNHPETAEFLIHNITDSVDVSGSKVTSFMTSVAYDRTITEIPTVIAPV